MRLRRTVARALRRAIAGSVVLALLAIGLAVAATVTLDDGEAGSLSSAASTAAISAVAGPPLAVVESTVTITPPVADPFESIAPDLAVLADEVEPPVLETVVAAESQRRVATSAITEAAGPPLSIEERHAEAVQRAAERDDVPIVIEPPFEVILASDPVLTPSPPLGAGDVIEATVSFYYCEQGDTANGGDGGGFCGAMRDGTVVYEGAAACAFTYLGQQFRIAGDPTERVYTCHDTGSAVHGLHRDIFFHSAADGWPWLQSVGTRVILEIVR